MSEFSYDEGDFQLALNWASEVGSDYPKILVAELRKLQARVQELESAKEPTGVWQIELTNGTVHNFVADRISGGVLFGPGNGLTEFVMDTPAGRSFTVLAVRPDLVVSYRRLEDYDGDDSQLGPVSEPFAGPVRQQAPTATAREWLKTTGVTTS